MLKLIRLEWQKNNIGKYIRNAVILAVLLSIFMFALCYLGIANDPETGVPDAAPGNSTISAPIELFSSMSFLVFTGVMLSTFIVSAYQNKTMDLMFSYPIKRQKILVSQMLAVWIFNFAALVLTKLLLYGVVLLGSQFRVSGWMWTPSWKRCGATPTLPPSPSAWLPNSLSISRSILRSGRTVLPISG